LAVAARTDSTRSASQALLARLLLESYQMDHAHHGFALQDGTTT